MEKVLYQEIKKELLKDENIVEVSVNSNKGIITIKPRQDKSYLGLRDPLENFLNEENGFTICDTEFKLNNYEHFNTQILELEIKEL